MVFKAFLNHVNTWIDFVLYSFLQKLLHQTEREINLYIINKYNPYSYLQGPSLDVLNVLYIGIQMKQRELILIHFRYQIENKNLSLHGLCEIISALLG